MLNDKVLCSVYLDLGHVRGHKLNDLTSDDILLKIT